MMTTQGTKRSFSKTAGVVALLFLLPVTLLSHNWPTAIICGSALVALLGKQLGLLTWYGRCPKPVKIALAFLVLVCLDIPIVLLAGDGRMYAIIICVLVGLPWLAWLIWRERHTAENRLGE